MIQAILIAFKAMSWAGRIAAIVGPLLLLGTTYAVWHHQIYQRGYDKAISDIAEEDSAAIGQAVERRKPWKECRDRGGVWSQSERACK